MLDTRVWVETPEGIDLSLRPASPIARALAWLIDGAIRVLLYLVASLVASIAGAAGIGLSLLLLFLLWWVYPIAFEQFAAGATPGKRALGLKVVQLDGTPVSPGASVIRNLLRAVDGLPLGYALGLTICLCQPRFQRLGDLAAGTLVVYTERRAPLASTHEREPLAPPAPLQFDEQQAVVDLSARATTLGTARAAELASLLRPLTGTSDPAHGLELALRYAAWLRRRG